jgi:molecular chaperone DnaJ
VYNARKNSHGDQIVEISIQAPDVRDERTRELLRKLGELDPRDPRADIWAKV